MKIKKKQDIENFINETLKPFLPETVAWVHSQILPKKFKDSNWRNNVANSDTKIKKSTNTHLQSFISDLDRCEENYEIERWQKRVYTFLETTKNFDIAYKFKSLSESNNPWDAVAHQKGYLEALLIEDNENEVDQDKSIDSKFWLPNHFRLFLSHLSSFKIKTAQLQKNLREYGISSFVAHEDIEPTKEWHEEIERALHSMDALAAILTPKFNESLWTDQEVGVAVGRDLLIIPIRKGMDPYGLFGKYQGMQGEGENIGEVSREIFELIANHPKTKEKMVSILIDQVLLANSENEAIKKLDLVVKLPSLSTDNLERLRDRHLDNKITRNSVNFVRSLNQTLKEYNLKPISKNEESVILDSSDEIPF